MSAVGRAPAAVAESERASEAAEPRGRHRGRTDRLMLAIVVLCLLGAADAGYLTYVHYAGLKVLCLASGGCETVQASKWAELAGIPVCVLGLISYIAILGSLFIRTELGRAAGAGIALIGFLFSMYLTYRELFTIHAICQWCVGSAVVMTVLAVCTAVRFVRAAPAS
jgi:uncharacterized membrane protein